MLAFHISSIQTAFRSLIASQSLSHTSYAFDCRCCPLQSQRLATTLSFGTQQSVCTSIKTFLVYRYSMAIGKRLCNSNYRKTGHQRPDTEGLLIQLRKSSSCNGIAMPAAAAVVMPAFPSMMAMMQCQLKTMRAMSYTSRMAHPWQTSGAD